MQIIWAFFQLAYHPRPLFCCCRRRRQLSLSPSLSSLCLSQSILVHTVDSFPFPLSLSHTLVLSHSVSPFPQMLTNSPMLVWPTLISPGRPVQNSRFGIISLPLASCLTAMNVMPPTKYTTMMTNALWKKKGERVRERVRERERESESERERESKKTFWKCIQLAMGMCLTNQNQNQNSETRSCGTVLPLGGHWRRSMWYLFTVTGNNGNCDAFFFSKIKRRKSLTAEFEPSTELTSHRQLHACMQEKCDRW